MDTREFQQALRSHSLSQMQKLPKSDLHSHAGRGGTLAYIGQWAGVTIQPPAAPFDSLGEMNQWLNTHVKCHSPGISGYVKRVEAAFAQAAADHIQVLALSYGIDEIDSLGGMDIFLHYMELLHHTFAPDTEFYPDLALMGPASAEMDRLDEIFSKHWFHGVDIINYQNLYTMAQLKTICRKAHDAGLICKAHVGEFDCADNVLRYAEELELDEIQHGIAAADSPMVMNWLADHKIKLNVSPASNIMLKNSKDYCSHPIRTLFDYGVPVTVNSDDLIVFNSSVSQEYLRLYESSAMNEEELCIIWQTGLQHGYPPRPSVF